MKEDPNEVKKQSFVVRYLNAFNLMSLDVCLSDIAANSVGGFQVFVVLWHGTSQVLSIHLRKIIYILIYQP